MSDNGDGLEKKNPIEPEVKPEPKQKEEPKDFKIAEIWIKNDTVALDAVPNFWTDRLRALGILEYCKEIVKEYNPVTPKVIHANSSMLNKLNRMKNRLGGAFGKK